MIQAGLDATLAAKQGKGISRFITSFLHAFAAADYPDTRLTVFTNRRAKLPEFPEHPQIQVLPVNVTKLFLWEQIGFPGRLSEIGADVALVFSDRLPVFLGKNSVKFVLYLFECPDFRIRANRKTAGIYQRLSDRLTQSIFPVSLKKASHIAASSIATKKELIEKYKIPAEKISVIYPAPDPIFRPSANGGGNTRIRRKFGAPEGYVLHFSSNNDPRDNTGVVLQAFKQAQEKLGSGIKLVIGGVERLENFAWDVEIKKLGLENEVRFAGFKTGEDLADLYRGAELYLDPSLFEGFGFQVAEAMACGTPVICSNVSSLPEVAGDAAVLVRPDNPEEISSQIFKLLSDAGYRTRLKGKGVKRSLGFSWPVCVQNLMELMHQIA